MLKKYELRVNYHIVDVKVGASLGHRVRGRHIYATIRQSRSAPPIQALCQTDTQTEPGPCPLRAPSLAREAIRG